MKSGFAALNHALVFLRGLRVKKSALNSSKVQAAVFATKIEERIAPWLELGADHFADQDEMIAAVVDRMAAAFEAAERAIE